MGQKGIEKAPEVWEGSPTKALKGATDHLSSRDKGSTGADGGKEGNGKSQEKQFS